MKYCPSAFDLHKAAIDCNTLDLLNALENKFKMQQVSVNLMAIAVAKGVLISNVLDLAKREVSESTRNCTSLHIKPCSETLISGFSSPYLISWKLNTD